MENCLKSEIRNILENERGNLTEQVYFHLVALFEGFADVAFEKKLSVDEIKKMLDLYLSLIKQELTDPSIFGIYHKQETSPIDFYSFAIEFFRPFVNKNECNILGKDHIEEIMGILEKGENVILLANHQTEADPTLLGILLDDEYPGLIRNMTAIAGARVTSDPVVTPMTRGQNIICVYSKRYFDHHPEQMKQMQQHNSSAMIQLRHLLSEGGKLIYIAPSGGRDRKNEEGILSPAQFNPDSIELMRIVGEKAEKPTHFFPLAMYTYPVLPPPEKIKKEIGEERKLCHSSIHIAFGKKIHMNHPSQEEKKDKELFRVKQASSIYKEVVALYNSITT
jgi:glycerol-3-phosphate O-acyltransferase